MPARVPEGAQRGPIMAIGGAEDKTSQRLILKHFWSLAGGQDAQIVILPTASAFQDAGQVYARIFAEMDATHAEVMPVRTRGDALNPVLVASIELATGVFITGGNQLKLATILGGTPIAQALRRRNAQGMLIGGTSAGAAILAEHMIAYGRGGPAPYQRMVNFAPGLGLTNRLIIDQHFTQRKRFGRLMAAVAHNPFLLGVGLDEDMAMVLDADNCLHAIGKRSVVIMDGSEMDYTDIHDVPAYGAVAMLGLRMHVLTQGCRYDVNERKALIPAQHLIIAPNGRKDTVLPLESETAKAQENWHFVVARPNA